MWGQNLATTELYVSVDMVTATMTAFQGSRNMMS